MNENENKIYDGKQLFKLQFVVAVFSAYEIFAFIHLATVYTIHTEYDDKQQLSDC